MATISKRANGYQVQIRRRGYPNLSKVFDTKRKADAWARKIEAEMDSGQFVDQTEAEQTILGELLKRYLNEVTQMKKSAKVEAGRILRILNEEKICLYKLTAITSKVIAGYRDKRLLEVTGSSVNRDLSIFSHVFTTANREWGFSLTNPVQTIRKPRENPARERRLRADEEARLFAELEPSVRNQNGLYEAGGTRNQWIKPLVIFAIETGMRRGEILSLKWDNVDLTRRVVRILDSKNGEGRSVPLTKNATALLQGLPRSNDGRVFATTTEAVKLAFPRAVKRAGIDDLHFHDLRHEAVSRLFEKGLNVMEVASVSGHKTLQMLKRYTHLSSDVLLIKIG